MTVAAVLAAGRRSAERLMSASFRITRKQLVNLDTASLVLSDVDPSDDVVYEGPGRLRAQVARVTTGDFEGQLLAGQQLVLHLPLNTSAAVVRTGDTVEVLDGGDDPSMSPRDGKPMRLRVQGLAPSNQATAYRFPVELLS